MTFVPFHQPHFDADDRKAALQVLESGFVTMGQHVFDFEAALADLHGRRHAVMVNACTNGHMLVFQYLRHKIGLPAGRTAVFPATTFAGPAFQAVHAGFHVELADTNPETGATDVDLFQPWLNTQELPAFLAPMPYAGVPLPGMSALLSAAQIKEVPVIEDCAHAIGARYADGTLVGSLPTFASVFSFYPTKVLNAVEGGMILTDDDDLAGWCRAARLHGVDRPVAGRYQSATSDWEYALPIMGYKCNPANMQGAIGVSQLKRLPDTLARLKQISDHYCTAATSAGLSPISGQSFGNQHLFILRDVERDRFLSHMRQHEVQCSVHYPPLWKMAAWQGRSWELPGAERFVAGCVSLPIFTGLSAEQITQIAQALMKFPPNSL
ncbi:MAG: DegT/DnrJ/EryC1/StrS family aminotransferase [Pseudoruegeria sp.]